MSRPINLNCSKNEYNFDTFWYRTVVLTIKMIFVYNIMSLKYWHIFLGWMDCCWLVIESTCQCHNIKWNKTELFYNTSWRNEQNLCDFFTLYLVGKHKILITNNKDIQLTVHISVHNYNAYKSKSLLYFLAHGKYKKKDWNICLHPMNWYHRKVVSKD